MFFGRKFLLAASLCSSLLVLYPRSAPAVSITPSIADLGGGDFRITHSVFDFDFDPGQKFVIRLVDPDYTTVFAPTGPLDWDVAAANAGGPVVLGQVIDSGMTAPEPSELLLSGIGLGAVLLLRRRRS